MKENVFWAKFRKKKQLSTIVSSWVFASKQQEVIENADKSIIQKATHSNWITQSKVHHNSFPCNKETLFFAQTTGSMWIYLPVMTKNASDATLCVPHRTQFRCSPTSKVNPLGMSKKGQKARKENVWSNKWNHLWLWGGHPRWQDHPQRETSAKIFTRPILFLYKKLPSTNCLPCCFFIRQSLAKAELQLHCFYLDISWLEHTFTLH